MTISKDMSIIEVVKKYPVTVPVFKAHGMGCIGCSAAKYENIAQGAAAHGIDVQTLIRDLQDAIKES